MRRSRQDDEMSNSSRTGTRGILFALASAALFGVSTPVAKLLLGEIDPWLLAGLLYLGSGLGLAGATLLRRALGMARTEAPLRRSDLPWLVSIVVCGGLIGPVLLMIGLARTEASSASLLLNLEGLATMTIAWIVFRENVDRRILLGALAILAGAAILSWKGGVEIRWGTLAIVGACLAWGIDNNLTRKLSSADPVQIALTKGLVAGAVNVGLALLRGASLPVPELAIAGAVIGFLGYGVSLVLFVLALRQLGTARTGAYFSTAPFIGAIVAIVIFGEPVTPQLLAAAGLMAAGLYLHLVENHEHEHEHEPFVHEHAHTHDAHHAHAHRSDDPAGEPHVHVHAHTRLVHRHPHYPDIHHRHPH
jgi:drug/metabolite transporter (DMT)-like permease